MDGGQQEFLINGGGDNEQQQQYENNNQDFNDGVDVGVNNVDNNINSRESSAGKLFVGGIAWETSEESFSNYFSNYGELTDSVIMMDKITGRPRGFGFVTFANPADADKVLEQDHVIDGRPVEVKRTVPRDEGQVGSRGVSRTKKIFVGGIPLTLTEDEMREYFSNYGDIVEHQIMLDHVTGRSRGFGFVTFDSEEAVEKIFVDGQLHELGGKQVEIKRAEPKRAGGDFSYDNRSRRGGGSKSYGGSFGRGSGGYGGSGYGGKGDKGYDDYGGNYAGGYDGYGGGYGAGSAAYYGGYGGYGYGYGYGGPMYGSAGYAGAGYAGYGGPAGYGGGRGYGSGSGSGAAGGYGGKGYGRAVGGGSAGAAAAGVGYGYGYGYGYDGSKGYDNGSSGGAGSGSSGGGRFHPYRK